VGDGYNLSEDISSKDIDRLQIVAGYKCF
jgi:hypothetical protein